MLDGLNDVAAFKTAHPARAYHPAHTLPYISKWRSHILLYEPTLALKIYILLATTVRALPMLLLSQQARSSLQTRQDRILGNIFIRCVVFF